MYMLLWILYDCCLKINNNFGSNSKKKICKFWWLKLECIYMIVFGLYFLKKDCKKNNISIGSLDFWLVVF